MKPKSFNRDMKKELAGTLAAHGVAAVIACAATASAWTTPGGGLYPSSQASPSCCGCPRPTRDPSPPTSSAAPLEAAADTAASGQAGELLAALALVAASVLILGLVSWGRSWARLHDGTFAGDRAPTRTHGDAWLESRPSRVARRCPPWDGKAAAEGLVAAGCIGGGNDHYMAVLDEEGVAHDAAEDLIKFYAKPLNGWTPAMLRNGWYAHMRPMLESWRRRASNSAGRRTAATSARRASGSRGRGGCTSPTA